MLAAAGQWVTNEKTLLDRAGLRAVDGLIAALPADPGRLAAAVDGAGALLRAHIAGRPAPGAAFGAG